MYRIRTSLLIYYLVPMVVLLVGSGAFFYTFTKRSLDGEMGRRLVSVATATASFIRDYHIMALQSLDESNLTFNTLQKRFQLIEQQSDLSSIYIANLQHQSLVDSQASILPGTSYSTHMMHQSELRKVIQGRAVASVLFQGSNKQFYKRAFAPIFHNDEVIAVIGVEASAGFFHHLSSLAKGLTYFVFASILSLLLLTAVLSAKIVRPIEVLSARAREIGEGNTDQPIEVELKNEIGVLGHTLEDMRQSILTRDTELQTMLRGIAHEVRNPLGGIELFAGLLEEDLPADISRESLNRIKLEIKNLKLLVEEFLDFARGPVIVKRNVHLRSFVEDLIFYFSSQIQNCQCKATVDIAPGLQWLMDPDHMKRVFFNLIDNALHAITTGGSVHIAAASKRGELHISVDDTGTGISEDNLPHIFDPFFTTRDKGSGLGLAFVRKIVRSHGGEVTVSSAVNHGTTFHIVIPS